MGTRSFPHNPTPPTIMKTSAFFTTALLAAGLAAARAEEPAAPTLAAGDAVTTEAFESMQWIQGERPEAWEPGKVYMLECWATWCGPCIAMIPHVNHLHKTYSERGLRVIALSVWEDDFEKTRKFVEDRGDGMSYPVAFVGRGGAFETDWLTPAGVRGIPHAFIVHDGKLIARGHPSRFTDAVINQLLSGEIEEAAAQLQAAEARQAAQSVAMRAFSQARVTGDADAMAEALQSIREFEQNPQRLHPMEVDLAIAKGDWPQVDSLLDALPQDPRLSVNRALNAVSTSETAPAELIVRVVSLSEAHLLQGPRVSYHDQQTMAGLLWRIDRRDDAVAALEKAVAAADDPRILQAAPYIPVVLERVLASARDGEMPDAMTIRQWYGEAAREAAAGKAND